MSNIQTVQSIYRSFGEGDIAGILDKLHENIAWDHGLCSGGVPWLEPITGRVAVQRFFAALGALDFKRFQPGTMVEADGAVIAVIDVAFVVKSTGRTVEEKDEVHIWHFDESGLATKFNHKVDTHQHWLAWRGE